MTGDFPDYTDDPIPEETVPGEPEPVDPEPDEPEDDPDVQHEVPA